MGEMIWSYDISPISSRVFSFFARVHRLAQAVPTSPKQETAGKRTLAGTKSSEIRYSKTSGRNHLEHLKRLAEGGRRFVSALLHRALLTNVAS
jgi:hypothetical protein